MLPEKGKRRHQRWECEGKGGAIDYYFFFSLGEGGGR